VKHCGPQIVSIFGFGDCRKAHDLPRLLAEDVANQIILMQALHDDDDGAAALVVLAAIEGVVEPIVGGLPLGVGERFLRLQRIIDQDDVGAPPGQHPTIRGGQPVALAGSHELLYRLAMGGKPGREDPPIPRARHDTAAVAGELVREILGIADAEELGRRVVTQTPGRKGDRGQQGFQMARRQVDDQAADLALAHRGELGRDHLKVPVDCQFGQRVQIVKAASGKGGKILPQQDIVFGSGQVLEHRLIASRRAAAPSVVR